jgi:hypothetical protein
MCKKLVRLLICLSACLALGSLAPIALGARSQHRTATEGTADQTQAGSLASPGWDQATGEVLTTMFPISQPYLPAPLSPFPTGLRPDDQFRPNGATDSHQQLNNVATRLQPLDQISLPARQVLSHTMKLEPDRLHQLEPLAHRYSVAAHSTTPTVFTQDSGVDEIRPAAVCQVNSPADGGPGTLRHCIAHAVTGDIIRFDTAVFPPASPTTIALSNPLPWIITDSLTIDAGQAGVIVDGSKLTGGNGFVISGANGVKIQGLRIIRFPQHGVLLASGSTNTLIGGDRFSGSGPLGKGNLISGNKWAGIWIEDSGTMSNTIQGNLIGLGMDGTTRFGNSLVGVFIGLSASNNIVGGNIETARNVISGNGGDGIRLEGTTNNWITGNHIGTDISGVAALQNDGNGISISSGASNNMIGGNTDGARNLISGNLYHGIQLQDNGTTGNQIQGNFIGTDDSGMIELRNRGVGAGIGFGSSKNVVGGNRFAGSGPLGEGNLVSGNESVGIAIEGVGTTGNQIQGNYVGTNKWGTAALPNRESGIWINVGSSNNLVGGGTRGKGNLISGNDHDGISIGSEGTSSNLIQGNFIGTNVQGTAALPNLRSGISIGYGASANIIGGDRFTGSGPLGQGNLISGNGSDELPDLSNGIHIWGEGTNGNQVRGNFIGTDVLGKTALGNGFCGVWIGKGASDNTIGGDTSQVRNLISGNEYAGVAIVDNGTDENEVHGNFIGTDVSGTEALGNAEYGLAIGRGASGNTIGADTPGARNVISSNGYAGIWLQNPNTANNIIQGNFIGTDEGGTTPLGNYAAGIVIGFGASHNLVGGDTIVAGNTIAFNGDHGVAVQGSQSLGNTIRHNSIHHHGTLGIDNINGGNTELPPPMITAVISTSVVGQAQPGHVIELFSDNGAEGQWFENSVTADATGFFLLTYSGLNGSNLTATATDAQGNTSEFSASVPAAISGQKATFLPIVLKNGG